MNSSESEVGRYPDGSARGQWWGPAQDASRIDCLLCPRKCSLKPGDQGFCFVRENRDGEMALSTYGRSTGFCIDPIEKKPLNHFYPGTPVLSFGTAGCNLGCKFCQNWDISKSREVRRLSDRAEPEQIAEAAVQTGCRSVAFTYNDPVVWAEYAIDTAAACRARGIQSVAVTAGYICDEPREAFFHAMDAANIDLKAFSEEFYEKITGSRLQPVLDTIRYVHHETDVWLELTNLIIPDANDSPGELRKMCDWILEAVGDEVPIHFTAFHPDFRMQDRPRTDPGTLNTAVDIAQKCGIKFPYVGNVHDVLRQSTYCQHCRGLLIERDWHQLGQYHITSGGACQHCGQAVPGRFASGPGDWGNKRQPIRIDQYTPLNSAALAEVSGPALPIIESQPTVAEQDNALQICNQEKSPMSTDAPSPTSDSTAAAEAAAKGPLQIAKLTSDQRTAIVKAATNWVAQAVYGQPVKTSPDAIGELTHRIVMGVFVSLKRGDVLRGCCGVMGKPMALMSAITAAAARTAKEDKRFAPISPSELPYLTIEVSLLGPFQPVEAEGDARADAVVIGKHGVTIQQGEQTGLLLPTVATQRGWDASRFLDAVCSKAGLRPGAWKAPESKLMVFDGEAMTASAGEFLAEGLPQQIAEPLPADQLAAYAQLAGQNIVAITTGATPSYVVPQLDDVTVNAIVLSMQWTREGADGQAGEQRQGNALQVSFRPGVPLQSTLFQMCQRAAVMFQQERFIGQLQIGLTLGFDPALHGWGSAAELEGIDTQNRGVAISDASHCGFAYDPSKPAEELSKILRSNLPIGSRDSIMHSMHVISTMPHVVSISGPTPVVGKGIRPAAVAGKFYPAEDAARREQVRQLTGSPPAEKHAPLAVMVPHAALKYSGQVAANTWQSIEGLDGRTLIVISPKHVRAGVNWSVCPFGSWQLSQTTQFAGDSELASRLAEEVTPLVLDASAHAEEHGIEVQLPILEQVGPNCKVLGLALMGGSWVDIQAAAKELATVIGSLPEPPLLVISSDMNHYAPDADNRRRDRLALDALAAGDAEKLLDTCRDNEISMCGVIPAALVLQTLHELGQKFRVVETGYATSGDISGNRSEVVGYAGALFLPAAG